jgi:hypothetical protein
MFLKLHDIEDSKKRDFILETLRKGFRDVVIEARKVFERFNMLGSCVNVIGTNMEEIKLPIPFKLMGMHEALERILIGLFLKTLLMKVVNPRVLRKDLIKCVWIKYNSLLKILLLLILMLLYLKILDSYFLRLAQRR